MIKQLFKEAFKQGYRKGFEDEHEHLAAQDDADFEVWVEESIADGYIGDVEIPEFMLENIRREENKNAS